MNNASEKAVVGLLVCAVRDRDGRVSKEPHLLDTLETEQPLTAFVSKQHWKAQLIDLVDARGYKCEAVSVLKQPKYGCNIIVAISLKDDTRPVGRSKPVSRGGRSMDRVRGLKTMAHFRRVAQ